MEAHGDTVASEGRPPASHGSLTEEGGTQINDETTALSEKDLLFFNDHTDLETADFLRQLLLEGTQHPGDCGVTHDKPSWVDDGKIRLGQQFATKYFFGVVFANVVSELILFTLPGFMQPFVFTGSTAMPIKAVRRYLSTFLRVNTWYTEDLWAADSKARRNLMFVRGMHNNIRRVLQDTPEEEFAQRSQLQVQPWAEGVADALKKDFSPECADLAQSFCPVLRALSQGQRVSQLEMSLTQLSFVGVHVTFPEHVGAGGASEAELEGFVHLWRALGHLLGVEERFNVCAGGLDALRRRTKAALKLLFEPSMAHADDAWEHMARSLLSGLLFFSSGVPFEVSLVHVLEAAGAAAPRHLRRRLGVAQRVQRRLLAWALRWAPRVAPLRARVNRSLLASMRTAYARADDDRWLREQDQRVGYAAFQKRQLRQKDGMELLQLRALAQAMNFRWERREPPEDNRYGQWEGDDVVRGGINGDLSWRHVHVGFCCLWLVEKKLKHMDVTHPWGQNCYTFLVPRPTAVHMGWGGVFHPFQSMLWLCVSISLFVVAATVALISKQGLLRSLSQSLGQLLATSFPETLPRGALRPVIASWSFLSVLLVTAYGSKLVSHLTVVHPPDAIDSFEKLVQAGFKWGLHYEMLMTDLLDTQMPLAREFIGRFHVERDAAERVALVARGDYAVFGPVIGSTFFLEGNPILDQQYVHMVALKQCLSRFYMSFGLPRASPLTPFFNVALLRLQAAGFVGFWMDGVTRRKVSKAMQSVTAHDHHNNEPTALTLDNVSGAFAILVTGLVLAIVVSICELILYRRGKRGGSSRLYSSHSVFKGEKWVNVAVRGLRR